MKQYPGLKSVVDMLRELDDSEQDNLLRNIGSKDPDLVDRIRNELFQLNDFLKIDPVELGKALQSFDDSSLLIAMKLVPDEVRQHIYHGWSDRKRSEFEQDFKSQGPHPLSKAKTAVNELKMYIKLMVDSGRIGLSSKK